MVKRFHKIKLYVIEHKVLSVFILIVLLLIGYWGYKKATSTSGETRYLTAQVERGTIVTSVSGTGQVSAGTQIDLKAKASGDVVYIGVQNGERVLPGRLILELDAKDAQRSVRDAETTLASAKIALEKLKLQNSNENLTDDLTKAYDDASVAIASVYLDLPEVVLNLQDILSSAEDSAQGGSSTAKSYSDKADAAYYQAKKTFDQNKKDYRELGVNPTPKEIEEILQKTESGVRLLAESIKSISDLVAYLSDTSDNSPSFTSIQTSLSDYTDTVSVKLSNLTTADTNLKNSKESFQDSDLDIKSAELSVTQRENALLDAKDELADYFIRAPFAGVVTNVDLKRSDSVSAGTVVGIMVTDKELAEISMNEVDVAKIKLGEKATLTFDALPDLTVSGSVVEIDAVGTVDQGVVTYNVKINFDKDDSRIKPAMSVSAEIITDTKENVLLVPNSAIKSQGEKSYVEEFETPLPKAPEGTIGSTSAVAPQRIPVEVGISNDRDTEIISGINEDEEIVVRTISPTAQATSAPSIFGSPSRNGGGARTTPRAN